MAGSGPQYIGRYRADRVVGSGAFATVWLAEDETLAAPVAIKVLADNWAHDEEVRQRFLEEARILWRADSDHIVRIHNVDELPDGRPYFVMDFADRGTLHERMRERIQEGGRYSIDEAVAFSLAIADGLKVAHALGIVHRDLKPANIMFQSIPSHHADARDEKLILTDFGMAKSVARARGTTIATGTPYYMAPEQTEGRADERSDIYSAGVVLYELLSGRVPYPYDSPGRLFAAQVSEPPARITTLRSDVPAPLEETLHRALASDPEQRWPTAEAWAGALTAAAKGEAPPPLPAPLPGVDADALRTMAPAEIAAAKAEAAAPPPPSPPAQPGAAPPPPTPPVVPPPAPPAGDAERKRKRKRALAIGGPIALVLVGVVAAVLAIVVTGAKNADAKTLTLDPIAALGQHPFTPSVVPTTKSSLASLNIPPNVTDKLPAQLVSRLNGVTPAKVSGVIAGLLENLNPPIGLTSKLKLPLGAKSLGTGNIQEGGNAPGLYGGTQLLSVCDKKAMVAFLIAHRDKLDAWAKVQGLAPANVADYINHLTDVVLQVDTRVTNHGFNPSNNSAFSIDEVLQAGTAVLIDEYGIPRARCYCGNPLTPPRALAKNVTILLAPGLEKPWKGFTVKKTVVVKKAKKAPEFGTIDIVTGTTAVYKLPGKLPQASTLTPTLIAPIPTLPTPTVTTPTETAPTETTPTETTPTETTPTVTTPTVTAPPPPPPPAPPPPPPPVENITSHGSASASSIFSSQYPASAGVDGNPATSWFSVGDKEGNTSTYTWTSSQGAIFIDHIQLTSNYENSVASIRSGFTFTSVQVEVLHNGTVTDKTTVPYPATTVTVHLGHVGDTVQLLLIHHTNPACGGFGELGVFGHALTTSAPAAASGAPDLTGSWQPTADPASAPWQLTAGGPGLSTLHASWRGSGAHSGLVGSFQGTLVTQNGVRAYTGSYRVTEGGVTATGPMVFGIVSANEFLLTYRQSNGATTKNAVYKRVG